jgi:ribosome-associated protein
MIEITPNIALNEEEIHEEFVRASGPGGQHVNKTATAVQLRFNVLTSPALPERVRARLLKLGGSRITTEGELVIVAQEHRSQARNRQEALERLIAMIQAAAKEPKRRRKTRPTLAAQQERIAKKKRRGHTKQMRGPVRPGED